MSDNWVGQSGSWGDAGNWSSGLPKATDAVSIAVAGITVSINTGVVAQCYSLNVQGSTISLGGGSLYTVSSAVFNGSFFESAGTYTAGGSGAAFDQGLYLSGGTIDLLSGNATLFNGGSLAGTFAGNGALVAAGGSTYINGGFSCALNSIVVGGNGGKLGFNINFSYAHNFSVLRDAVLSIFGHTLTLSGTSELSGVIGFGTITESAAGTMAVGNPNSLTTLDNGLVLNANGHTGVDGNVALGANDAGAKINIGKPGIFAINGNWNLTDPSHVGYISNAGTLAKAFGGLVSQVDANFNNTGTVNVQVGTLLFDGAVNTLGGTVSGAGTLALAGGQTTFGPKLKLNVANFAQQGGIVVLNKALSYSGTWNQTGGILNLNAGAAALTLAGQANFDGGTLTGYGGTLNLNGVAHVGNVTIGGPDTINIKGTLDQTNSINFGLSSNPTANIAAGGKWLLEGDSSVFGIYGLIYNAGLFSDPNGSGDAVVQSQFINGSTGTLTVNNSTLTMSGGYIELAGAVNGSGLLDIQGNLLLDSGVNLSVAALALDGGNAFALLAANLSYGNIFSSSNGNAVLDLAGHTLALTGRVSLDTGEVTGGGTLTSAGATFLGQYDLDAGTAIVVSGTAEQSSDVGLGGALTVAAHATYAFDDDVNINPFDGTIGTLAIGGTLSANGAGNSIIDAVVVQTGSLIINDQILTLQAGGSLGGAISGPGTLALQGGGGNTYTLAGTVASGGLLVEAGATAAIQSSIGYAGFFAETAAGTVAVSGDTLTLSGTVSLAGSIQGSGTVLVSGAGTLANVSVSQGATLSISGSTEQTASIQVGDNGQGSNAELVIAKGGNYTLDANASITGNGTLAVAGTLTQNGNGISQIGDAIVNTGVIAANLGTLQALGAVGGSGTFSIGKTGFLDFTASSTFSAAGTVAFTAASGEMELDKPANFLGTISNFSAGDAIGLAGFNTMITDAFVTGQPHNIVMFSDNAGDSVTLTFSTVQTLSQFFYGTGANGLATIFHH
jgi:hypothetical protein